MNESENLLILSLVQQGCLAKDSNVKSLMQISNDDFARMLFKLSKKIISIKGMEINLPETLSRDLNSKYRECQKIVEFIKQIGYKADLNLNNILFPNTRDMQRLFEFLLEYITNVDSGVLEYGQNISEKNIAKIKTSKQLTAWTKEVWLIPELKYNQNFSGKNTFGNRKITLKYEKNKINILKKLVTGTQVEIPGKSIL